MAAYCFCNAGCAKLDLGTNVVVFWHADDTEKNIFICLCLLLKISCLFAFLKNKRMKYKEQELIKALEASFKAYKDYGARSTAKLKPLHKFLADTLRKVFGKNYSIHFLGEESKEMTVEGKYYPKDIDITVAQGEKPVFCLGIKFVTSNYKQNANNYFENMMGETANIQAIGNLPYAQLIILRHETPYYLKNETETPSKIEIINDKDIAKSFSNLKYVA
jgi:hypothetical protein